MRLAFCVVAGANEGIEAVEQSKGGERGGDGFASAARDDGEGYAAVLIVDVLDDFGDGLELREQFEIQALLADGDGVDGHLQPLSFVEGGDDFGDGSAAPGVKELFVKGAIPFGEGFFPGNVMQGHGVDDGAIAIEEIRCKGAGRQFEFHAGERIS